MVPQTNELPPPFATNFIGTGKEIGHLSDVCVAVCLSMWTVT